MSTGEFKDMENCSLLEGEDSVSKGGTQILCSCNLRAEFVCSLPLALTEKVGGWVNQAMVGCKNGVLQFWSRCTQALGLMAQFLRRCYFAILHSFLGGLFILMQTVVTFAGWFACFLTWVTVLYSTCLIILESTPLASESPMMWIKVLSVQAIIASVMISTALYKYSVNRREEHRDFLDFVTDEEHGLQFFRIVTVWVFSFLFGVVCGVACGLYVCLVLVAVIVYSGFTVLIGLLLYYGPLFILSIVKYIIAHMSGVVI